MNVITLYQDKNNPIEVSVWRTVEDEVFGRPARTIGVTRVDITDNGELIFWFANGAQVFHRDQYTTFEFNYNI